MNIKKLFFDTIIIMTIITTLIVILNSVQIRLNASKDFHVLQKQYIDATYDIYKNEIIGDILVGNEAISKHLLDEMNQSRKVGVILTYEGLTLTSGKYTNQRPLMPYELNIGNGKYALLKIFPMESIDSFGFLTRLFISLILEISVLVFGFYYLMKKIRMTLLRPIYELIANLDCEKIMAFQLKSTAATELKQLHTTLQKMNQEIIQRAQYEAESKTAKQVAHDIRSPLACLNLLLADTAHLPEKQRILMRASIQRITDIANTFQDKAKKIDMMSSKNIISDTVMISSIMESLITEKRVQLGSAHSVHIDLHIERGYHLFSTINPIELKRTLSNLLNNSIEACSELNTPCINVIVEPFNHDIRIIIRDNGKGIPENILQKIGNYGFSFGKNTSKTSGNGLGVYHAIETIRNAGGLLAIESTQGKGTTINITLPQTPPPVWFIGNISLQNTKQIIVLDDDSSIHQFWDEKFSRHFKKHLFEIKHFFSTNDFSSFFIKNESDSKEKNSLFLIDFELIGQEGTGLDLIEKFHLEDRAILVTSHQDDSSVIEKAISMRVKIIPKNIISYICLT